MASAVNSLPGFGVHLLHPRYWLSWLLLVLFYLISLLPISVIDNIAELLAVFMYRSNKKRVHFATVNLSLCFPEKSQHEINGLVRQHFTYHMKSAMHYGLIWWASEKRLKRFIHLQGSERVQQIYQQGQQVIALTSHSTGLEFAVLGLSLLQPASGPYKSMKNDLFDWLVARGRTRFGVRAYTREQGFRPLIRDTKQNRLLIYLADEDLGADRSVFAPFFGVQKASVPVLGRLARQCNAKVIPCVSCYDDKNHRYDVKLLPAIEQLDSDDDEVAATQMNAAIENTVRECVAQYLWTLRLFKTRPQSEASVYG